VQTLDETHDLSVPGRHPGFRSGTTLWLFRHGEVHADWHGKAYGGVDVPLSDAGLRDTEEVARSFACLRPALVASSTLQRARRLGEALAASTRAPLELDNGLVEIARGRWQGMRVDELWSAHGDEVRAFYADPWNYGAHGGETDRDVLARAWPALERALQAARGGTLFVACHYNVMRILIARAAGIPPEHSFRLRIDLSAVCRLSDGPAGWQLERANVRTPQGGFPADVGPQQD
jgi:broad specificity phosphatase PhoE